MSTPPRTTLANSLRALAARAADAVGGGCALVFAALPDDDSAQAATRLRAAAGFTSAERARNAAASAIQWAREASESGKALRRDALPETGRRGEAGTRVLPLDFEGRARGVLVVGLPDAGNEVDADAELRDIAAHAALRIDHAHLRAAGEHEPSEATIPSERGGDEELLRLSEALFAQDIELMRSNEKLGKIERLKNDFIEKMSRELRTPLNSIIEAIIAVLAGEHEQLSDTAKQSLRSALDEGTTFQRTLQNILDLWRIKQNELPVEVQEVNIAEVAEEAIFSVQDALGDKAIEIVREVDGTLPKVRTDLAKVSQLLFLLLDNAVKFTPHGRIFIRAYLRGERLVCEVEDTGIGVCPDDQEYVFEEFFQVDAHSSDRYRGAGLGLSLVRDLTILLDGELLFESEAGRGSRVCFEIPVETV